MLSTRSRHPAIAMQVLGTRRLVCAARPEQLGRYRGAAAIPAEGLKSMPLIEVINTDPVGSMVARYAERFEWPYAARLAVKTHQIALDLAASGLGAAVVDDLSATRYAAELEILPIEPAAALTLVAMPLKSRAPPVAAARFGAATRVRRDERPLRTVHRRRNEALGLFWSVAPAMGRGPFPDAPWPRRCLPGAAT